MATSKRASKRAAGDVLSARALGRAMLARQFLLERSEVKIPKAVEQIGGLQSQWPKLPFVGLFSRLTHFQADVLRALLRSGKVVRATWVRGTLHLVSAADYLAFRMLLDPMLQKGALSVLRDRAKGLDVAALSTKTKAFLGHESRTFEQIRDHLAGRRSDVDARAMGYLVRLGLPLVQVPTADVWSFPVAPEFALAEAWLDKPPKLQPGAAEKFVRRYLAAFGPATVADYQTFTGLSAQQSVFEGVRDELVTFRDERGRELFDLPKAPRPDMDLAAPPRFLPEFDSVLLAHHDRSRIVKTAYRKAVFLPGLRVAATLLLDGEVGGVWKVHRKGKVATLTVSLFRSVDARLKSQIALEAYPLCAFLEPDAEGHELELTKA